MKNMTWRVNLKRKTIKQVRKLPDAVKKKLIHLIREIEESGPIRWNWPNYSQLSGNYHHCHLKKGNPTYVAVWEVIENEIQLVEICYAGTHEKVRYRDYR